ncbi:unnamed protein product [Cuscuta europaea]|uniref:Uncharacterized protein n=1 Tax=Cuscuta europaea TaxID=41803 RepID=A0A9P0ZRV1_CUSEU|nr:unnamed protein product [Cuscuta europaea]
MVGQWNQMLVTSGSVAGGALPELGMTRPRALQRASSGAGKPTGVSIAAGMVTAAPATQTRSGKNPDLDIHTSYLPCFLLSWVPQQASSGACKLTQGSMATGTVSAAPATQTRSGKNLDFNFPIP